MKQFFAVSPLTVFPLAVLVILLLSSCNQSYDAEIVSVLQQNAQTAQSENLAAYMNTYHSKSPARQVVRAIMTPLFKAYNLRYTVSDIKVESRTSEEIRAQYTLLTQKADNTGPPFRDNKTGQLVTFKKENGQWKIYEAKINKIEYVD